MSARARARLLLLFLATLTGLASCADLGDPAVVTVGSESWTMKDLRRAYADLPPGSRPGLGTREDRIAFVDQVIRGWLLREFGAEIAASDPRLPARLERERQEILLRRLRVLEGAGADTLAERLRREAGVRFHDDGIELLVRATRKSILEGRATEHDREWAAPLLAPGEEAVVVAEWKGVGAWTAADYRRRLLGMVPRRRPHGALATEVRSACEAAVAAELYLEEAARRKLDEDWWVRRALRHARENRLVQLAVERVRDRIEVDPAEVDSIGAILLAAEPNIFHRDPRARILRFDFPTPEAAREGRERILDAGGGKAWLARILGNEVPPPGSYHITFLSPGGIGVPEIERAVFEGGPGVLIGPHDLGGAWVLIECLELEPGREPSEEEIRADVAERIRRGGEMAAIREWVGARRTELGVSIDEAALDALGPGA